uniref:Nuclear pore complex protein Nup85 n=1 Tax=Steinernema glaseri TaxID=37863 RepID=A0A1I7XYC5_9BILA
MLVVSGKQALLLRIVTEFCRAAPTLLGHCFHRIAQLGDQETADKVLLDTFVQHPDLHPSDPIWLDHVQPCTLAPENFGPTNEVIMKNVSVLFDFLDFGANRRDERAWFLLKSNVESLMLLEGCASLLPSLWEPRRDWWPRFHVVDLSPVGHEYRTFVFNVLYSLSAGD